MPQRPPIARQLSRGRTPSVHKDDKLRIYCAIWQKTASSSRRRYRFVPWIPFVPKTLLLCPGQHLPQYVFCSFGFSCLIFVQCHPSSCTKRKQKQNLDNKIDLWLSWPWVVSCRDHAGSILTSMSTHAQQTAAQRPCNGLFLVEALLTASVAGNSVVDSTMNRCDKAPSIPREPTEEIDGCLSLATFPLPVTRRLLLVVDTNNAPQLILADALLRSVCSFTSWLTNVLKHARPPSNDLSLLALLGALVSFSYLRAWRAYSSSMKIWMSFDQACHKGSQASRKQK